MAWSSEVDPSAAPRWRAPATSLRSCHYVRCPQRRVFFLPDGRVLLSQLSASFSPGRTGLIGANGSGKSTLLRLIAGRLRPTSGSVTVTGEVGYLPQDLTLDAGATVAVAARHRRRRGRRSGAIEAGSVDPAAFDAVGDDWDVEDRAREWLARLGLAHVGLDDPVGRLSGGEAVLTALSALLLRRPAVLLLDEPTNNLDLDARRRLYAAVAAWPGVLLIVSHDRALLSLVDQVADLSGGALRMYGGNLEAYEAMLATEQAAAQRAVSAAEADVRREKPRPDGDAGQAGPAGPAWAGALAASGSHTADRRRRAQARGAGVRGQGPGRRARPHRRRADPARRGGGGAARRRGDPDLAAGHGGARRADRADRARARRAVGALARGGQPGQPAAPGRRPARRARCRAGRTRSGRLAELIVRGPSASR